MRDGETRNNRGGGRYEYTASHNRLINQSMRCRQKKCNDTGWKDSGCTFEEFKTEIWR